MNTVFKGLLLGTTMLVLVAAGASAQTATSNSNSTSGSNSTSQSGSNSRSQIGSQQLNASTVLDQRSFGSPNTTSHNQNNGDVTVRTTPQVYAPPVSGGNPCTLAVSGGVSVIGWGASAGGTFVDEDCANRQKIAMVHNAGYHAAARELMCNDRRTYDAFKSTGQACGFREAFEPKGAVPYPAPVQVAPQMPPQPIATTVVVPTPPPVKNYPRCDARRGIVDNCRS